MKTFIYFVLFLATAYTLHAQTITFTLNQQPCNNDGIVTASFPNIGPPWTVYWYLSDGTTIIHTGTSGTTDVLNNYSGEMVGVYAANSQATDYGYFSALPFDVSVTSSAAICPNLGSVSATISGGASPYTYQWINSTSTVVSTANPASLPGGAYSLKVTDNNGCVVNEDSGYVAYSSPVSFMVSPTEANCTNGAATVSNLAGGLAPYTYLWSNGATSSSINNLITGNYNVTVTDAQGCHTTNFVYVPQAITIDANVTPTNATCIQNDGAITTFGSGGMPPYSYLYSNGATAQTISNLPAGSYSVTVTDANGCTGSSNVYLGSTTPISVTYATTPSSCTSPTGSATLNIVGGVAPYNVTWNTTPVQTGVTASNLPAGNYYFQVTDANGCMQSGIVVIDPADVISLDMTATDATCTQANGSIGVTAIGGATPYTYAWSNSGTTATISGLAAGGYNVVVTDNNGCSKSKYGYVNAYSPIGLNVTTTPATCIFSSDGSIQASVYGGTAPYTYNWSNGQTSATISGLPKGNYNVAVSDANGCTASEYTALGYDATNNSCYCTITGTVYNDANNNCTVDAGEQGIPDIQVGCSSVGYTYTDANGQYSFMVPTGNYTVSETVKSFYPLASCQNNNVVVNTTASSGCANTVNFANSVNTIHDISVATWDYTLPVPGYPYMQQVLVTNEGTVAESGIVAGYKTDGQINAPSFSPALFAGSGNNYNIASGFPSLAPGQTQVFNVNYIIPANIPLNTDIVFTDTGAYTSPISNWENDYSPWDNVNYKTALIVGSFDPNFIEVNPKGTGANGLISNADTVLQYMVHFQNIGTYMAQNVVVVDTLDANLDWTSLMPVYESAPCKVTLNENGVATFTFNNIKLPAKIADSMASSAMFTYTVRIKNNLPAGTQFRNHASVYFDYNAPVVTDTTLNTLGAPAKINNVVSNGNTSFSLYPNPAGNSFSISINSAKDIDNASTDIYDLSGKRLIHKNISLRKGMQTVTLNSNELAAGIYFVELFDGSNTQTQKLVIVR